MRNCNPCNKTLSVQDRRKIVDEAWTWVDRVALALTVAARNDPGGEAVGGRL
jgi:hypothetical protein